MKRLVIPVLVIIGLVLVTPVFATNSHGLDWGSTLGDRHDYSWTVREEGEIVFQEDIYVVIENLTEIPESISSSDAWSLSETGFEISTYWDNETMFDPSSLSYDLHWHVLPIGNWSLLQETSQGGAVFFTDETYFGYELYDVTDGSGVHRLVKFLLSSGVIYQYHMHLFLESVAIMRLDFELTSSTLILTSTTSPYTHSTTSSPSTATTSSSTSISSSTSTITSTTHLTTSSEPSTLTPTPDVSLTLPILVIGGGVIAVLVVALLVKMKS